MKSICFLLLLALPGLAQPCTGIVSTYNKPNKTKWLEKVTVTNALAKNSSIRKISIHRGIGDESQESDNYLFLFVDVFTKSPKYSVDAEATLVLSNDSEIQLSTKLKPKLDGKQFYSSAMLTLPPDRVEEVKGQRIIKVKLDDIEIDINEVLSRKIKDDINCVADQAR